jgi:hypothetical protein
MGTRAFKLKTIFGRTASADVCGNEHLVVAVLKLLNDVGTIFYRQLAGEQRHSVSTLLQTFGQPRRRLSGLNHVHTLQLLSHQIQGFTKQKMIAEPIVSPPYRLSIAWYFSSRPKHCT